MRNSVYTEKQSFWTWWLILLFVIIWMMQLQSIYVSNWKIDNSNYVELGILLCVFLFLAFVRLHTKIDEKGISIRSEERRVGKECRSRWSPDRAKEKSQIIVYDQTAGLQ